MEPQWDARFHVFGEISKLISQMFPAVEQFTARQSSLLHRAADQIARDLTSGQFVYVQPSNRTDSRRKS